MRFLIPRSIKSTMLFCFLAASSLYAAEPEAEAAKEAKRVKEIVFHLQSGEVQNRILFHYDAAGNITSIAEFDQTGVLESMQYYFYADNCLAKILKFQKSVLLHRREIIKTSDCQKIMTLERNPAGELTKYVYYTYQNNFLKTLTEYAPNHQPLMRAEATVTNGRVVRVDMQLGAQKITMHYEYDAAGNAARFRIDAPAQMVVKIQYETGPVTSESARYLYE